MVTGTRPIRDEFAVAELQRSGGGLCHTRLASLSAMIDDHALRALAEQQHGLASAAQAADLGYDRRTRRQLADGRRWSHETQRVLRLVGAPRTDGQRAMLAVLDAGPGAALRGTSAAAWWGIPGNLLRPITVAHTRAKVNHPPLVGKVHDPCLLPDHHVVVLDQVPTVVPARALFDVAGMRRKGAELPWWVERMARMVDTAWSMRLVSGASIHDMLEDMAQRGRPGIRVMRQVLASRDRDYVPPASSLESRVIQILARAGEPALRRQVDTGDEHGWIGRVDLRDEQLPFVLEVQSERFHSSLIDRQLDADRSARLRRAGFVVAEVTEQQVWHRPHEVVDTVRRGRADARAARTAA